MNYTDAERLAGIMESLGYSLTTSEEQADIIILVACAVRQLAVNKLTGNGKKFKKYRQKNPNLKTILTGCILNTDKKLLANIFDIILDIQDISNLPKLLQPSTPTQSQSTDTHNYLQITPKYQNLFTAYVPIMTGCNNFCSYCVVPYTRGREYSRPAVDIIKEIKQLLALGYKEIILLGQNVNSYKDNNQVNLPALLQQIDNLPGHFWIRFLTSHPKDMTEELLLTVKNSQKLTPFIHLALQSGSNQILQQMNRKYTKEHFLQLTQLIKQHLPNATITTDIIVGFPGETSSHFQETLDLMNEIQFDMAYINKYSPRKQTASYQILDNVNWEEKKSREQQANHILRKTALVNNQRWLQQLTKILILQQNTTHYFGKTETFKDIQINKTNTPLLQLGEFYTAQIINSSAWSLEGKIIVHD